MKFLTCCLLLVKTMVFAQPSASDEIDVKDVITRMFDGMKKADSTLLKPLFLPGATLQTVAKSKTGEVSVKADPIAGFIKSVGSAKPGALDERLSGMTAHIDGELATVWTPYTFYYNQQKRHCGANAFTLVKVAGRWQIQNIIDTRRQENCPE
ncbi:MAG: nuclear transport factor 2 family protein [Bacteroidetes bacterium]|nr:nuclear transport factor 2 family protein [Fibrella sp.]